MSDLEEEKVTEENPAFRTWWQEHNHLFDDIEYAFIAFEKGFAEGRQKTKFDLLEKVKFDLGFIDGKLCGTNLEIKLGVNGKDSAMFLDEKFINGITGFSIHSEVKEITKITVTGFAGMIKLSDDHRDLYNKIHCPPDVDKK